MDVDKNGYMKPGVELEVGSKGGKIKEITLAWGVGWRRGVAQK